ncbi:hypothetical protein MHLP_03000 [Candidatus Mycoplasma haematolamae str. Purdue]|uniref:Uncharacterized protein n=1 Tax=Mycoplasma haematolamae (strain Purdue) TaxID=1212765 RepID=I7BA65_MYCHA|nr:hypothetical protein [Candidatus Mycoplasma haematolamae]AFO52180.1 hypothetical protein MHLP_03000 [Candidatus Mycoplasma haematolamae str. Purdue]
MTRIQVVFTGLTAGTGVAGGTHLYSGSRDNIHLEVDLGKSSANRYREVFNRERTIPPSQSQGPQNSAPDLRSEFKYEDNLGDNSQDTVSVKEPEALATPIGPEPEVPPYREEESAVPNKPSKTKPLKGTKNKPEVICVTEETELDLDIDTVRRHRMQGQPKQLRAACIKKNTQGYEKLMALPVCTQNQMYSIGLKGEVPRVLDSPDKLKCRYWDSFSESLDKQLQITADLVPKEYFQ